MDISNHHGFMALFYPLSPSMLLPVSQASLTQPLELIPAGRHGVLARLRHVAGWLISWKNEGFTMGKSGENMENTIYKWMIWMVYSGKYH